MTYKLRNPITLKKVPSRVKNFNHAPRTNMNQDRAQPIKTTTRVEMVKETKRRKRLVISNIDAAVRTTLLSLSLSTTEWPGCNEGTRHTRITHSISNNVSPQRYGTLPPRVEKGARCSHWQFCGAPRHHPRQHRNLDGSRIHGTCRGTLSIVLVHHQGHT